MAVAVTIVAVLTVALIRNIEDGSYVAGPVFVNNPPSPSPSPSPSPTQPPPIPSVNIRANGSDGPITVASGATAGVSWSSSNATSCTVSPTGWTGTGGLETITARTTATYTANCAGAGGSASDSVLVNVTLPPAPTINAVTPASAPLGTEIAVTGSGFANVTGATVGGVAAAFSVVSDTQLTVTVPADIREGTIVVTNPGGSVTSNLFTVMPPPAISSLSPTSGSTGDVVAITGTGFTGVTAVSFSGTPASFTVQSDTRISAIVSDDAASGPVSISAPSGAAVSSETFTVVPPAVSSPPPAQSPAPTSPGTPGAPLAPSAQPTTPRAEFPVTPPPVTPGSISTPSPRGGAGTPPVVSGLRIAAVEGSVSIVFKTDQSSRVTVSYGKSKPDEFTMQTNPPPVKNFDIQLAGLEPNTNYAYQISVQSESGGQTVVSGSFTTAAAGQPAEVKASFVRRVFRAIANFFRRVF